MKRTMLLVCITALLASCSGNGKVEKDIQSADLAREVAAEVAGELFFEPDLVERADLLPNLDLEIEASEGLVPQCDAGEGCFLDPCSDNEDCQSGWCVQHLGEGVCSKACQEECPPGWSCQQVSGTVPDVIYICVSDYANLCRPCSQNADCTSVGGAADACIEYGPDGSFCGGPCSGEEDCPWGFSCVDAITVEGTLLSQCVNDGGECPCTEDSVALGLTTPCNAKNEYGLCHGKRTCTEEGLSDCSASVAMKEVCNGVDDDCDGELDEPDLVEGEYLALCDDGVDCTEDACMAADGCVNEVLDSGSCDDLDPCTVADHCEEGACVGKPVDCDDDNACTKDACTAEGGCENVATQNSCDDEDSCTVGDVCTGGTCIGTPVSCECKSDEDCASLEDGDLCNGTLVCDLGKYPYLCVVEPETVVQCEEPAGLGSECLKSFCDPETGHCSEVVGSEGMACSDGDACTFAETCLAGACIDGMAVNCNDGNGCTDDGCDSTDGCFNSSNTEPCDDDNLCTVGDLCVDGACSPGVEVLDCDDGDLCTKDSCSPEFGCVYTAQLCDDGDPCTLDTCHGKSGSCVYSPLTISCAPCMLSVCNSVGGELSCEALNCDDENACTQDGCELESGVCHHQAVVCDDDNPCTDDSCDVLAGCGYVANSSQCDDGDACTINDQCGAGLCEGGGEANCNDGNFCTDDSCDAQKGCSNEANQLPCSDGDVCTLGDSCAAGSCVPGVGGLACDDGNLCTDDSCNALTGCEFGPNQESCDDGDACTPLDVCDGGECVGSGAVDCDDGNFCTDDSCDFQMGCQHADNSLPCDDGDVCSTVDICADGACVGSGSLDCDDGNDCTDDACDAGQGCQFVNNEVACDDDNACTATDGCQGGVCVGSDLVDCDDGNECTEDTCDADGCVNTYAGLCAIQPGPAEGKDHYIGSYYNSDPNGTATHFRTGGWGDKYWALLQFPLDNLPEVASKATIRLFGMNDNHNPTSMHFDRNTTAWAENCTWGARPSYVNLSSIPPSQVGVWYEIDVTALYNGWKAGTYPNHGVQFRSHGTSNNYNGFWSSDYSDDASLRPMLVVEAAE
jgi:hypothetical protein